MMQMKVLKNKEAKNLIIKILVVQLIFICSILIVIKVNRQNTLQSIIDSKAQIVASIVDKHPQLEDEIVSVLINETSEDKVSKGQEILSGYGYNSDMDYRMDNQFQKIEKSYIVSLVLITLIMVVMCIIINYMQNIYIKVESAYMYVDDVLRGDEVENLDYEGEGEFPILANEINKIVSVIKKDNEIINKEKIYLKEILADISHQLKTPLTSIKILTDILIDKEEMDKTKRIEFLNKVSIQSEKMEWLIYSLLKIARLEAGTFEFSKNNVGIGEIIGNSKGILEPIIQKKNIKLNIIGDKVNFICDKEWTTEAVTNIIKNAIEHSYKDSEISITTESNLLFTRLIIKDNGEGISKEDLPHIFKRFYKGKRSSKSESIGIGLALAKSIIEKQDGYVLVRSELGKGTEFELTFIRESKKQVTDLSL